jgi:methyltransferase (TIGR00027 family)
VREDRASMTAYLIARSLLFLSRDPETAPLVPPETAEASGWFIDLMAPADGRWVRHAGASPLVRQLAYAVERLAIPGVMLHYAVRKRFLEDAARRALADGVVQVVVLGAGFDTLALRLHREYPQVLFVECDHPATQRVKRRALEAHARTGPSFQLLPVDLARRSLAEVIASLPEYSHTADTLLIAEGLTMYLREEEIDELFAFLWDHAGAGSRFAFTFMEPQANGKVSFPSATPFVRPWLRLVGEPFTWGVRRQDLPRFLAERGFTLDEVAGDQALRERYLAPAGLAGRRLAVGEYVCLARRMP